MLDLRLSILPPNRRTEERIVKIGIAAGTLVPDFHYHRRLARIAPLYAKLLISEGKKVEAIPYLDAWYAFFTKIMGDARLLLETWAGCYIIKDIGEQEAIPLLESIGEKKRAASLRHAATLLCVPFNRLKAKRHLAELELALAKEQYPIRARGSILALLLIPSVYMPIAVEDLAPGRYLDHLLGEWLALFLSLVIFVVLMLAALVIAFRWRFSRGMASSPLLLLPNWKETARILGNSVLLPIALYFVYSRYSGLARRDFSIEVILPQLTLELAVLVSTVFLLAFTQSVGVIRQRCAVLNIPMPPISTRSHRLSLVLFLLVLLVLLSLRFLNINYFPSSPFPTEYLYLFFALLAFSGFIIAVPFIMFTRLATGKKKYGLYYGTVARSLIPIFAAIVILVGCSVAPYLAHREAYLLKTDTLLGEDGFGIERKMVEEIKRGVREAQEAISREGVVEAAPPQEP
ncbi:MAG: hypothetical protein V1918_05170 [Planctomycetota bacterium]